MARMPDDDDRPGGPWLCSGDRHGPAGPVAGVIELPEGS